MWSIWLRDICSRSRLSPPKSEADLYDPVKRFLEGQGFTVKGEVGSCDLLAVRGDEPPVIVELKLRFNLELLLQGVDRLALTDQAYLAVPEPGPRDKRVQKLLRRLGLGFLLVAPSGRVDVILDPQPYQPRKATRRLHRLLGEHKRRIGDPSRGGVTRTKIMTAYRQEALRCAYHLAKSGPTSTKVLRELADSPNATKILHNDVYGWFERVARGVYQVTPLGFVAAEEGP